MKTPLRFLVLLMGISAAAHAAVITGVVVDSATDVRLGGVAVGTGDSLVSTRTDSAGAFTLTIENLVSARPSSEARNPASSVLWNPGAMAFTWAGYGGAVSIRVVDIRGVVRASHSSNGGVSAFALPPLPPGMYLATIAVEGSMRVMSIMNPALRGTAHRKVVAAGEGAGTQRLAKAAAVQLFFSKPGWEDMVFEHAGGDSVLAVKLRRVGRDSDGICGCPDSVVAHPDGAQVLMGPALRQAKRRYWHLPSPKEEAHIHSLIRALKAGDAPGILAYADSSKLRVCRSITPSDTFLVIYTKPGVNDYMGPFFMFRETADATPVIMLSPHNQNGEGTEGSTQSAFQRSRCLAYMSNGHSRTISGDQSPKKPRYPSDYCHSRSCLSFKAFEGLRDEFPNSIFIMFHGMSKTGIMICDAAYRHRGENSLFEAFRDASKSAAEIRGKPADYRKGIVDWRSDVWVCARSLTDNRTVNNNRWIGLEMGIGKSYGDREFIPLIFRKLEEGYLKGMPVLRKPF